MSTSSGFKRTRDLIAVAAVMAVLGAADVQAQDYKLGVSAMLTGPISSLYAAQAEGIRVFFDSVNANGGINGRRVSVSFRDNRGDPSVAASNAQAFVDGDVLGASLLSASNTVPGFAQVTTRAGMPVVNASWCYGPSVPGGGPKVAESYFCAGFSPLGDVRAIVSLFDRFAERLGKGELPGFAGTDAPGNVVGFKQAVIPSLEHRGWKAGGYLAAVPFGTTDYTPAARALLSSGAKAIVVWCPADCALQFIRALRASGFKGPIAAVLASAEPEFRALKDPELYLILHYSLISEGKPIHAKIADAAKRFDARAPANDLLGGWYVGMAYAKGLSECGFPCTRERLVKIFNSDFKLDDANAVDVISGKLMWNANVHHLKSKSFQVVHWDNAKGDFVRFGAALDVEDPGLVFPKF